MFINVLRGYMLLFHADLYLTMNTQVQLVPGFQFAGQRPRYSTTQDSAASLTSGRLVSETVQHDIWSFSTAMKCTITSIERIYETVSVTSLLLS